MGLNNEKEWYLAKPAAVRRAIDNLANRRSHNHLPGYLALLRLRHTTGEQGTQVGDIEDFYTEFLTAKDAPSDRPFLQPFLSRGKGVRLQNKNVQGSYAPSSIRDGKPLSKVVNLIDRSAAGDGREGVEYSLVPDHADKVLSEMLVGNRLLGASLAVFLFRDHKIALNSGAPSGLVSALREFLGIRENDKDGNYIFEKLFEDDSSSFSTNDFEKV